MGDCKAHPPKATSLQASGLLRCVKWGEAVNCRWKKETAPVVLVQTGGLSLLFASLASAFGNKDIGQKLK